jgi:hypothetical protein
MLLIVEERNSIGNFKQEIPIGRRGDGGGSGYKCNKGLALLADCTNPGIPP